MFATSFLINTYVTEIQLRTQIWIGNTQVDPRFELANLAWWIISIIAQALFLLFAIYYLRNQETTFILSENFTRFRKSVIVHLSMGIIGFLIFPVILYVIYALNEESVYDILTLMGVPEFGKSFLNTFQNDNITIFFLTQALSALWYGILLLALVIIVDQFNFVSFENSSSNEMYPKNSKHLSKAVIKE